MPVTLDKERETITDCPYSVCCFRDSSFLPIALLSYHGLFLLVSSVVFSAQFFPNFLPPQSLGLARGKPSAVLGPINGPVTAEPWTDGWSRPRLRAGICILIGRASEKQPIRETIYLATGPADLFAG